MIGYPSRESVTAANPIFPDRIFAMFHCSTHNLKANRNQLYHSVSQGSRCLTIDDVFFGWGQVWEAYHRDCHHATSQTKLRLALVDLDGYSLMCVSYAKAPFAQETLLEQCYFLAHELGCLEQVLQVSRDSIRDIYTNVVPIFKNRLTETTSYNTKATLNALEYAAVVGAIFNDFFLNRTVNITKDNIDRHEREMVELLQFYDEWYDQVCNSHAFENNKDWEKQFLLPITFKILKLSIRGFFEYCRIAFGMDSPPAFVLISHSNSSSIEAVFASVRNMRRDTPQGFVTAASVHNLMDAIHLIEKRNKPSYSSDNIPDRGSPTKDILQHKDKDRQKLLDVYLSKLGGHGAIGARQRFVLFCSLDTSTLSDGYAKLTGVLDDYLEPRLSSGFFLVVMNDNEFLETMKAAMFTDNQPWYQALAELTGDDQLKFDETCRYILLLLFTTLSNCSQKKRAVVESSYQYHVYTILVERDGAWREILKLLPQLLRTNATPICLLILHLSDWLLEWVREAMIDAYCCKKNHALEASKSTGDTKNEELVRYNPFLGWAIFSLTKKLERDHGENEFKLSVLELMTIFHNEAIRNDRYMTMCYSAVDQLRNRGGLTLVSIGFFGFGRGLLKEVSKFTLETFQMNGNKAIEYAVNGLIGNAVLRRIFLASCRSTWAEHVDNNTEELLRNESELIFLYEELCKKTMHAWAGEQSRKYKEKFTNRRALGTNKVALRNELNVLTKKKHPTKKETVQP